MSYSMRINVTARVYLHVCMYPTERGEVHRVL